MTDHIFKASKQAWEDNLKLFPQTRLWFPDENLVRLFSGRYIPIPPPPAKVLEHGFGHANTLEYLVNQGYECSGCEISQTFIDEAKHRIRNTLDLRLVEGLELPYEYEVFDIVVSWNVIHYNGTKEATQKVVEELHRVLKPGGTLLLSTVCEKHSIIKSSKHLGFGSYLVGKITNDNREGLTLFCPGSSEELVSMFSKFSLVDAGSASAELFNPNRRNHCYLIYAVK